MLSVLTKTLRVAVLVCLAGSLKCRASMTVNTDYIKKPVVFLYSSDVAGNVDPNKPLGTGFIVQVVKVTDPGQSYKILVTARHIVDPQWANCPSQDPVKIFMRINKKNFDAAKDPMGTVDIPITLVENGQRVWVPSPDSQVDVALIPVTKLIDPGEHDVSAVNVSDFPTPDEVRAFATGDAVVSAGLVPGASGKRRNYPIFKFGNISSIPDEPVDTMCLPPGTPGYSQGTPSYPEKLWLIAASLVPGNSGSPIFFMPAGSGGLKMDSRRPVLLGVQSVSLIPWDIAGMTPAEYIYDLIEGLKVPDADLRQNVQPPQPKQGK